ncbi:WD40 repeat-like protein [Daedaleopsis nitida]|nr:WD40 repeat-like protein [Daedaleopsis nitida]
MASGFRERPLAWDIYANQLYFHGYGYPLWLPDPDPSACEVEIGDVGWVKKGGFMQLFNARKSEDDQPVPYGVPEHYTPFDPPNLRISGPASTLQPSPLYGRTVHKADVSVGAQASSPLPLASAGGNFSFKCSADTGGFLMYHPTSYSCDIESKRHVVNYIREHFDNWLEFANNKWGQDLKEEEIRFVCGTTKTSKWAVAAFHGQFKKKQGSISADLSSVAGLNVSVSISDEVLPQSYYNNGPRRRPASSIASTIISPDQSQTSLDVEEKADQCIFIHYYKSKRKFLGFRMLKAAAGPDELPPPGPDEADSPVDVCEDDLSDDGFEQIPRSSKPFDPVDDLLDYILENSEATMAIASDRDLYAIFKDQEIPLDIKAGLQQLQPTIEVEENGVGTVSVVLNLNKPRLEDDFADIPETHESWTEKKGHDEPHAEAHGTEVTGHVNIDAPAQDDDDDGHKERTRKYLEPGAPTSVHDGSVTALAYSPDGKFAASGSEDTTIIVWDVERNSPRYKRPAHRDTVSSLAFSRDNRFLASGSNDKEIIIWTVDTGDEHMRLEPGVAIHAVAYTPDGSKLIAGGYDGSLRIWDAQTYALLHTIPKHMAVVTFIIFSPDGRRMATGGTESECCIWDVAALGAGQGEPAAVLEGHKGMVCAAAFSADGRRIVTASDDGSSCVWSAESGDALVILHEHTGPVWAVAFAPDSKRVASGSSDSTVKVCDSYSGERVLSLEGHDSMINAVEFSPGGKFVASAASDNTVRLWSATDGSCVRTYNEHSDNVTTLAFSPNDATLASGSHDGTVYIRSLDGL